MNIHEHLHLFTTYRQRGDPVSPLGHQLDQDAVLQAGEALRGYGHPFESDGYGLSYDSESFRICARSKLIENVSSCSCSHARCSMLACNTVRHFVQPQRLARISSPCAASSSAVMASSACWGKIGCPASTRACVT